MTGPGEAAGAPGDGTTPHDEIPLFLPAGPEHVFAVASLPPAPDPDAAVLCLHAGARNLTAHRNRMFTKLCREVAASGRLGLRMDYHGTGDSSGVLDDRGIFGQTIEDVGAAVQWLTDRGATRIVAVGTCWGALVALVAAAREEAIVSVFLISPPLAVIETGASASERRERQEDLGRVLSQALRLRVLRLFLVETAYRRWVLRRIGRRAQRAIAGLLGRPDPSVHSKAGVRAAPQTLFAPLVRRRVPVRVLYGEQDQTYLDLLQQGAPPFLQEASEIIDITVVPFRVHGFTTVQAQETTLQHIRDWLAQDVGVLSAPASPEVGNSSRAQVG